MGLTNTSAKQASPSDKDYKLSDEKGLYLLVKKNGRKYWRMKYRFANKEKLLSIGVYPEVSLKEARQKRDDARKIESRGANETAKRAKQVAGQVFRYAVATGRAERDPSTDLKGALQAPKTKHFAAITDPKKIGPLLLAFEGYEGTQTVRAALQIAPMVFTRPGELRQMEWTEIDWDKAEWQIPEHKMKMKQAHIVPLCKQAVSA